MDIDNIDFYRMDSYYMGFDDTDFDYIYFDDIDIYFDDIDIYFDNIGMDVYCSIDYDNGFYSDLVYYTDLYYNVVFYNII